MVVTEVKVVQNEAGHWRVLLQVDGEFWVVMTSADAYRLSAALQVNAQACERRAGGGA